MHTKSNNQTVHLPSFSQKPMQTSTKHSIKPAKQQCVSQNAIHI